MVLTRLAEQHPDIFYLQDVIKLLFDVEQAGHLVHPTITLDVCSHEPDNRFLEGAVAAQANYLVTVNTDHFPTTYQSIKIVQPRQFYRFLFAD